MKSKNKFFSYLESLKSEDKTLMESFKMAFSSLFESYEHDYLETQGTFQGKDVDIKVNVSNVDSNYHPLIRGERDGKFGPALEPDEPEFNELVDYSANAKISFVDENGEPVSSVIISQDKFPEVMTTFKNHEGKQLNLSEYIDKMLQENIEDWVSEPDPDEGRDERYEEDFR